MYCGNSSVGRAQPCQGWGREFESRFPLKTMKTAFSCLFSFCTQGELCSSEATPLAPSRGWGCKHNSREIAHPVGSSLVFRSKSSSYRNITAFCCCVFVLKTAPHKPVARFGGSRFTVKFRVSEKIWDAKSGRAIGHSHEALQANRYLDSVVTRINTIYYRLCEQSEAVTAQMVHSSFLAQTLQFCSKVTKNSSTEI